MKMPNAQSTIKENYTYCSWYAYQVAKSRFEPAEEGSRNVSAKIDFRAKIHILRTPKPINIKLVSDAKVSLI